MTKNKERLKTRLESKVFNFFVLIGLAPIELAVRLPIYPLNIIFVVFLSALWAMPLFFIGSGISTVIALGTLINTAVKETII